MFSSWMERMSAASSAAVRRRLEQFNRLGADSRLQEAADVLDLRLEVFPYRSATGEEGSFLSSASATSRNFSPAFSFIAQNHTPPNTFEEGELRGVHMITGAMAQHWETDSQTVPVRAGSSYVTALANNQEYASYVNDGHRPGMTAPKGS